MTEDELFFSEEQHPVAPHETGPLWKLLIADDEPEIHQVTRLVLSDYHFEGMKLEFLSAFTGGEALDLMQQHPDTAVVLMDVVMETEQAGLEAVRHIREVFGNRLVRIILRTGQPGQAPEKKVIVEFDINDYKAKSELTSQKLFTTVTAALRSFRDLNTIERHRQRLEGIIRSLNVAQEVQQCLLPKEAPQLDTIDIAGGSIYCEEIGGDYFDFIDLPGNEKTLCVAVGDVSGHGVSAALLMAGARAYLRSRAIIPGSLADIIQDVNTLITFDTMETGQFMTLFFLSIEPGNRSLTWVRAGQDPALLFTPGEHTFQELDGPGIALGLSEEWSYSSRGLKAQKGQVLLLATDGIWETKNEEGEMFGKKRLAEVVHETGGMEADDIRQAVLDSVSKFQGNAALTDDLTLVVLKFR